MDFTEYDTRLAAYCVVVDGDRILLTWWNGEGVAEPAWTLPGGGVEFDETVEQAAVRECFEETGLHVMLGPVLTIDTWTKAGHERISPQAGRPAKHVRVLFTASVTGGALGTTEVGGTTDRAAWLTLEEVREVPRVGLVDAALRARGTPTTR